MTALPVSSSVPPAPQRRRMTIQRLADAVRALNENELTARKLRDLIEPMESTRLVPLGAERTLLTDLDTLVGRAHQLIRKMSDGSTAENRETMTALEKLLKGPSWEAARQTLVQLQEGKLKLDRFVRSLDEDRATYRLPFREFHSIVERADQWGVAVSEDDRTLADVWNRLLSSDNEVTSGRYDSLAVAMEFAKSLLGRYDLGSTSDLELRRRGIEAEIAKYEGAQERRLARAELFVISGAQSGTDVPFTVMLRRPGYGNVQETNLYDDLTVLKMDQELFRDIIEQITDVALRGLRSRGARGNDGPPTPDPPVPEAAAPDVAAPDAPGPSQPAAAQSGAQGSGLRRAEPTRTSQSPELLGALSPGRRLEMIGRRMYSLLIPDAMQRLIAENPGVSLTITSNNPELPWELLHDGEQFLCLDRMFARMPTVQTFPRRDRYLAMPSAAQKKVLLISSGTPSDLPEAVAEINEIEEVLQQLTTIVTITKVVGTEVTSSRLTDELGLGNYDLVHYAGHAGFDRDRPERSYLLLPNGERFRADRIQRLLEGHPIVFLNACESSRSAAQNRSGSTGSALAQSQGLASAFVYGGAQACVGSLWPVFDDSARAFARSFYKHLFRNYELVGEALRRAREESHSSSQDQITWAAYALYGNPAYVMGEVPVN